VDGRYVAYDYYRLTKARLTPDGKKRNDHLLCLGPLEGLTKAERNELADMLTVMIEEGQSVMSFNPVLYEKAMEFYLKYRESRPAEEFDPVLRAETERKEAERRRDLVTIRLSSLVQKQARTIGPEAVCRSTLCLLKVREFLSSRGWSREQVDLALMQIIARAIYPFSELKTVRYLQGNSALLEMFKIERRKVTKDALYQSAQRLWEVHREMEDFLHERVRSMFNLEEKILLLDISNTYFEGRMEASKLCFHGRSKEKRNDCKIVVLAAVVNTEGLLVRTMIYEGNRQDVTTVREVVGSLDAGTSPEARKIVVMDAGFYSADNVKWLTDNSFDYITVLPSGYAKFTPDSDKVVRHEDCRHQEIRLQMGTAEIDGVKRKALLVDSDAKALKEQSMHDQACKRYEEGLEAIRAGITKKGGTKLRDAVNARLGRLYKQYGAIRKEYEVTFTYEGKGKKEKAVAMEWKRKEESIAERKKFHGKYVLLTSLDENDEVNVWKFYNVIRTVEETFHTLKSDLDMRPVYHKSDGGIKAHLNLAVLAYWIVSVTKYRLKLKEYPNVRWDEIMRIAQAQVVVTAEMDTEDGQRVTVRQSTEAEEELAKIYSLLEVNPNPIGKVKSMVHPKAPPKNPPPENQ
ncbi:MAG: IS1634 family transposase, partial [Eubacteriales bacterium]